MYDDFLMHYGVKGMRWGIRKYQNSDGTLTREGIQRYRTGRGGENERWSQVKARVKNASGRVSAFVQRKAVEKKESVTARHTPVSLMSDQELKERYNRLNMERSLKQVQDDLNGKNKPKRSFGNKHPVIQQIAVTTAIGVASSIISNQLKTKADEMLAPKRMERAEKKGMLNKDLFPFVYNNGARISSYNNRQKEIADATAKAAQEATQAAEAAKKQAAEAAEAARQQARDAYVNKYHLASKSSSPHRVSVSYNSGSVSPIASNSRRPKPGQTFLSSNTAARKAAREQILGQTAKTSVNDLVLPGNANWEETLKKLRVPRG